jgi:hypothetical protein
MRERMRGLGLGILVLACALPLAADESLVKFEGGIGVIPVSRVDGTGAVGQAVRNVVRGVNPGGQPWVIDRLEAAVKVDGSVSVEGRGLLLAGGNNIGQNGGQSVRAVLFCGTDKFASDLVALDAGGNFRIEGTLSPLPPSVCDNPALLIVSGGGSWFAAGILKR